MFDARASAKDWLKNQVDTIEPPATATEPFDTSSGQRSPITEFNSSHTCFELLNKNGYKQVGNKWLSPTSESGIAGIQKCKKTKGGVERIYSHHGSDPLNDGFSHDAFDIYRILECSGDMKEALQWNPDITKHNQHIFTPMKDADNVSQANQPSFVLVPATQLTEKPQPQAWLIHDLLLQDSYALLFGDPEAGKSLVALDMAFCIAQGMDWHGHATAQSDVVYVAGEGHIGLGRRLKALEIKYKRKAENIFMSKAPAALTEPESAKSVAKAIDEICPDAKVVIIDTLHRNFGGGDENSSKDFGLFTNNIDTYIRKKGRTALLVHHSGHESKERGRGSSSIRASLDAEYYIKKQASGLIEMKNKKAKDFNKPNNKGFEIIEVDTGWKDDEGKPVTSVTIAPKDSPFYSNSPPPRKQLNKRDEAVMSALDRAIAEHGTTPSTKIKKLFNGFDCLVSDSIKVVHLDHWRDEAYPVLGVDSDKKGSMRQAFSRTRKKLDELGKIETHDDMWWPVLNFSGTER